MTSSVQLSFDYSALPTTTRAVVESARDDIRQREKRAAEDIIEIGKRLIEVKAALPHGQFGNWLDSEFGWSGDTASRFMHVAKRFGDIPQIAEIATSALYALASSDVPDMVRDHFIEQAASGKPVRFTEVRDTIAQIKEAERIADEPTQPPRLSVIDLNTGEIAPPHVPPAPMLVPMIREATPEERAFDRLVGVSTITQMDADAVAEMATVYRGEVARMYLRRAEEIAGWHARFVTGLRARLESPLRAVR